MMTKLLRKKCILKIALLILPLCGIWFIGQGTYIHAKAILAQLLLETAWSETLSGQKEVKPWPWADTWPVARLSVPNLGISRIVLAGASGSSLAFGPGHLFGSTVPGDEGNIIISGHRDTHFSFLRHLKEDDFIKLESNNTKVDYRVSKILVLDIRKHQTIPIDSENKLLLVTCYPFDAIRSGGPLRYLVIAEPEPSLTLT